MVFCGVGTSGDDGLLNFRCIYREHARVSHFPRPLYAGACSCDMPPWCGPTSLRHVGNALLGHHTGAPDWGSAVCVLMTALWHNNVISYLYNNRIPNWLTSTCTQCYQNWQACIIQVSYTGILICDTSCTRLYQVGQNSRVPS